MESWGSDPNNLVSEPSILRVMANKKVGLNTCNAQAATAAESAALLRLKLQAHREETSAQILSVQSSVESLQGALADVQQSVLNITAELLAEMRALLREARTPTPAVLEPVAEVATAVDLINFGTIPEVAGQAVEPVAEPTTTSLVVASTGSTPKPASVTEPLKYCELAHHEVILGLNSKRTATMTPLVSDVQATAIDSSVKSGSSTTPDIEDNVRKKCEQGKCSIGNSVGPSTHHYFQHTNFGTNPFNYMTGPFTVPSPNLAPQTAYNFASTTHVSTVEPSLLPLPYYIQPTYPYPILPTPTSLPANNVPNSPYSSYTTAHSNQVYPPHPLFGTQSPNGAWLQGYTPPNSTCYPHMNPTGHTVINCSNIIGTVPYTDVNLSKRIDSLRGPFSAANFSANMNPVSYAPINQASTVEPTLVHRTNFGPTYAPSPHVASQARPPFNQHSPYQPYTHSVTSPGNQFYPPHPPYYPQVHTSTPQYTTVFTTPQNHNFVPPNHNVTPPNHSFVPHTPNFDQSLPTMTQMRRESTTFGGRDPVDWLNKAEQFFAFYQVPEDRKLAIATLHLADKAADRGVNTEVVSAMVPVTKVTPRSSVGNDAKIVETTVPCSDVDLSKNFGVVSGSRNLDSVNGGRHFGSVNNGRNFEGGGGNPTTQTSHYHQHTHLGTNPFNYSTGPFPATHLYTNQAMMGFAPTTHVSVVEYFLLQLPNHGYPNTHAPTLFLSVSSSCLVSKREAALVLGQFSTVDSGCITHIVTQKLVHDPHNQVGIAHVGGMVPLHQFLDLLTASLRHNAGTAISVLADTGDSFSAPIYCEKVRKQQDGEFPVVQIISNWLTRILVIVDIEPDEHVKRAMNEINVAARMRLAATEKAEAEKILQIKRAEGEAESKYLSGLGIARQRQAIVDGLRGSVLAFSENVPGTSSKDVMDMVLVTQYFDTMKEISASSKSNSVFKTVLQWLIQRYDTTADEATWKEVDNVKLRYPEFLSHGVITEDSPIHLEEVNFGGADFVDLEALGDS